MRGAWWLGVTALLAGPPSAAADDAKALFDRGLKDMLAERYETGCPAIEQSVQLDPLPGAQFTLGACYERWGKLQRAIATYEHFVTHAARLPGSEQAKQRKRVATAKEKLAKLRPLVPRLRLQFDSPPPPDVTVTVDGQSVALAELGEERPVDPGEHEIVVRTGDGRTDETVVPIGQGVTRTVRLRLPTEGAGVGGAPDEEADTAGGGWTGMHTAAVVVGGIGLAGIVVGGITGGMVFAKKSEVDDNCQETICTPAGKQAADDGKSLAMVSNVTFAIGAAGLVGGTVLWLLAPDRGEPGAESAAVRWTVGGTPGEAASALLGVEGAF